MAKEKHKVNSEDRDKVKYLGRHLMIKGEFVEKLLRGEKTSTIRLGRVRPKFKVIIVHGGGRPVAKVEITNVIYKKVKELTDNDAIKDGYRSKEDLIRALRKIYGDLSLDDEVTIIEFKIIQRLDELSLQNPYMGLEPADIARLGLRYLRKDLDEKDIEILEDLTRTNSIRKTSIRLYGGLKERWVVRKTLRKALRLLRTKGLIKGNI